MSASLLAAAMVPPGESPQFQIRNEQRRALTRRRSHSHRSEKRAKSRLALVIVPALTHVIRRKASFCAPFRTTTFDRTDREKTAICRALPLEGREVSRSAVAICQQSLTTHPSIYVTRRLVGLLPAFNAILETITASISQRSVSQERVSQRRSTLTFRCTRDSSHDARANEDRGRLVDAQDLDERTKPGIARFFREAATHSRTRSDTFVAIATKLPARFTRESQNDRPLGSLQHDRFYHVTSFQFRECSPYSVTVHLVPARPIFRRRARSTASTMFLTEHGASLPEYPPVTISRQRLTTAEARLFHVLTCCSGRGGFVAVVRLALSLVRVTRNGQRKLDAPLPVK